MNHITADPTWMVPSFSARLGEIYVSLPWCYAQNLFISASENNHNMSKAYRY